MNRGISPLKALKRVGNILFRCVEFLVGLIVIACIVLIISYNYSFVEFTPEYSGEKFQRVRIGPISAELPESYPFYRQFDIRLMFQGELLRLLEYQSPAPCEISSKNDYYTLYNINNLISSGEKRFIATAENTSLKYSLSEIYQIESDNNYAINIIFDDGCAILTTRHIGRTTLNDEKERAFKGLVDIFLNNYQWLGNDSVAPRGFRTRLGVIKKNADFQVLAQYSISDGSSQRTSSSELSINFSIDSWPESRRVTVTETETDTEFSIIENFKYHVLSRLFPSTKIFSDGWHYSQRNINFMKYYSGIETRVYFSMQNGKYELLDFRFNAHGDINDNCYSGKIDVILSRKLSDDPMEFPNKRKNDMTYNIIYGYWDKFIQSSECLAL
ncbi:MAG: hypothetical protein LBO66_03195 [Deltaproteobacteria bacterium]|jgi:hypothetical protein|nr:hypothetical protein [Deltaproteobacteria bacterium]